MAWTAALWPFLSGFAHSIQATATGNGWDRVYALTYFYGFFAAVLTHRALHIVFPIQRQTGASPFVLTDQMWMLEEDRAASENTRSEHVDMTLVMYEV